MNDSPKVPERNLYILETGKSKPHCKSKGQDFATIGSEIKCDKDIFDSYSYEGWKDIHHDLLIICAAVEYADRRWKHSTVRWARKIHVIVPVIELNTWNGKNVRETLTETLRHLTGDKWHFTFIENKSGASDSKRQRPLFPNQEKEFVIAYSEGLDSLCTSGLYNDNNIAILVRVAKHRQKKRKNEPPFDRLPFYVSVKQSPESNVRSRGFKFAAITAIAAHLSKVKRIIVPESGQGALGPVLLRLEKIYSDYRNHPTFFRLMEKFIRSLLGVNLTYEQPRLWQTKGQTIAAFLAKPGSNSEQVINTRSCWQQRHNVHIDGKRRQCGICAACLLRRMSLHKAGVEEPKDAYAISNLRVKHFSEAFPKQFRSAKTLQDYGIMGAWYLQQLADLATETETNLKPYALQLAKALDISMDDVQSRLRKMLRCHSEEWAAFTTAQGEQSFLNLWTKGGRHG